MSRFHQRFSRKMMSEKRVQKFRADDDDPLLPRSGYCFWLVVLCHQYGISALISHMSFCRETVGGIAKCCLFSQATRPMSTFRLLFPPSPAPPLKWDYLDNKIPFSSFLCCFFFCLSFILFKLLMIAFIKFMLSEQQIRWLCFCCVKSDWG